MDYTLTTPVSPELVAQLRREGWKIVSDQELWSNTGMASFMLRLTHKNGDAMDLIFTQHRRSL